MSGLRCVYTASPPFADIFNFMNSCNIRVSAEAVNTVNEIMRKMQRIAASRTEPNVAHNARAEASVEDEILSFSDVD